jgi:hypothetical protein
MSGSILGSVGAVCFGIVVGYITYRTLVRKNKSAISDIGGVITAIGGGTVTALLSSHNSDTFGWYAIGLLGGMVAYFSAARRMMGKANWAKLLGDAVVPRGQESLDRPESEEQLPR